MHGQVQGVDGSVEVKFWETLDVLFVPAEKRRWVFSVTCAAKTEFPEKQDAVSVVWCPTGASVVVVHTTTPLWEG